MEHHILPAHPTLSTLRVPYVCSGPRPDGTHEPYLPGPFLEYPKRAGKAFFVATEDLESLSDTTLRQRLSFESVHEQETFVQAWLFFGLLAAFMRSVYNADDYIRVEGDVSYVTTEKLLLRMLESWKLRSQHASTEERQLQVRNAKACIQTVDRVLRACYPSFNWRIRVAIASVAELYTRSINTMLLRAGQIDHAIPVPMIANIYPPEDIKNAMISKGWCRSEIASALHRFRSLQTLVFLSRLQKCAEKKDHNKCGEVTCECCQINPDTYRTKHVQSSCDCEPIEIDLNEIRRLVHTAALPVLEVSELSSDSPKVQIVSSSPDRPFVAISHVWADGLGNPRENELPCCQILELARQVRIVQINSAKAKAEREQYEKEQKQKQDQEEKKDQKNQQDQHNQHDKREPSSIPNTTDYNPIIPSTVHFWVDTICCPIDPPEAKEQAIKRMRETYTVADSVLVVSEELHLTNFREISKMEALLRVFTSPWMQRLWTLQEGVLPKAIWIQFKDEIVDFDRLFMEFYIAHRADVREICIFEDINLLYLSIRRMDHLKPNANSDRSLGTILWRLDYSLYRRSVSFASDEPLCLANLFGFEPGVFDGVAKDVESRMIQVWKTLAQKHEGLPQRFLLLNYPRLQTPGFRWAPRTLLQASDEGKELRMLYWKDPQLGKITADGFHIRCRGINLTLHAVHSALEERETVSDTTLKMPLFFTCGETTWTTILNEAIPFGKAISETYPSHSELFDKQLAIIHIYTDIGKRDANAESNYSASLLGEVIDQTPDGINKLKIICPLILQKSVGSFKDIFGAIAHISERVRAECEKDPQLARLTLNEKQTESAGHVSDRTDDNDPRNAHNILPVQVPGITTRQVRGVNTGVLDEIEFPSIPPVIQKQASMVMKEHDSLAQSLSLLYFTRDPEVLVKMLAFTAWVTMRYNPEAEDTSEDHEWCIT